jgi:hypothetical protein
MPDVPRAHLEDIGPKLTPAVCSMTGSASAGRSRRSPDRAASYRSESPGGGISYATVPRCAQVPPSAEGEATDEYGALVVADDETTTGGGAVT